MVDDIDEFDDQDVPDDDAGETNPFPEPPKEDDVSAYEPK